jgi:Outer membrane protein beta-barrel domain
MKRLAVSLLCLFAVLAPRAAQAQSTAWVGFAGGMSLPFGAFADRAENAVDLGLTYAYPLGPTWGAGVDLYNHNWQGKSTAPRPDHLPGQVDVDGHRVSQLSALVYWFPLSGGRIQPYLRGGPGYYQLRTTYVANVFPSETQDHFGVLAGGGLVFRVQDRVGVSTDAVVHHVLARDGGSAVDAVSLTLGLILRFGL